MVRNSFIMAGLLVIVPMVVIGAQESVAASPVFEKWVMKVGDEKTIELVTVPASGYQWRYRFQEGGNKHLTLERNTMAPLHTEACCDDGECLEHFTFKAKEPGTVYINFQCLCKSFFCFSRVHKKIGEKTILCEIE
jgi:hypothetical protein